MIDDYDAIFEAYYQLFRGESTVPDSTDDEYIMGLTFANRALGRWANYDATYWKELWTSLQNSTQVSPVLVTTITAGTSTYTAPTDMREPGGMVKVKDSDGKTVQQFHIIDPQEVQFKPDEGTYAYFTGNSTTGFVLHLNPSPDSSLNGLKIDYNYYKTPVQYTTGTSKSEIANPWFIVHDMLSTRFQIERNYGGYQVAKRDAEEFLKNMHQDNNSGSWDNPWSVPDRSGSSFGI